MKLVPYINAASAILFEDDGSLAPELKKVSLVWDNKKETGRLEREGKPSARQYSVIEWKFIS